MSHHMFVRSGVRWLAAFGLLGMLFISGPRQATAEPVAAVSSIADSGATADAYSVVTSQAEELFAAAAGLFDSGSGRNAKTADQNRQLLIRIHERLDEYNQAFRKIVSFENERAVNRLIEDYLTAIIGTEEYYLVLAEDAEPTADQRHRFENLSNAVDTMMQYDDLFIGHVIPGMWLVLDSMHVSKRDKWAALIPADKRRKSLDARIENYKKRLQRALDDSQPTSLAGRAEALKLQLEGLRSTYIIKLNDLDANKGNTHINFWHVMGDHLLWNWDELEPSSRSVESYTMPLSLRCRQTREYIKVGYDKEEVATKFILAMNEIRDRIAIDVKLVHYYDYMLRNVRYALSVLEYGIWSVTPNLSNIVIEPKLNESDLLKYHDNLVELFDITSISVILRTNDRRTSLHCICPTCQVP